MHNTITIARRELSSFFFSPIAYVVMAAFLLLTGAMFVFYVLRTGEPASLRQLFSLMVWILIAIAPAISMRLIAEELRSGTIEPLMTSPVTDVEVVLGKWLGGVGFFTVLLLPTLAFLLILELWSDPDYGPVFTGYVGLLLVGGLYMAIGTFASVLTRNQIIAFLVTVFMILLVTLVTSFLAYELPTGWGEAMRYINVNEQFRDFSKGLIDTSNFVYFFSGIALFLVLAVKAIETRKWL